MNSNSQKRRDFMLKLAQTVGAAGAALAVPAAFAKGSGARITSVSYKKEKEVQHLLFKLDKSVKFKYFTLKSPDRIVIDFKNTRIKTGLDVGRASAAKSIQKIKKIRQANRNKRDVRVVLELEVKLNAKPRLITKKSGHFLDLALKSRKTSRNVSSDKSANKKAKKKTKSVVVRKSHPKAIVVAIDAGHGGKDPGAIGRKGTKEKDVVLKIAKLLAKNINRHASMKAVLTRDDDYYVSLRKRIAKARAKRADLFISIHADANPNRKLTGSSVYILSENGASSEAARWLANRENSYDNRLAGANLHRGNKVVSSMLLDLSLSDTIDKSLEMANGVLKQLSSVNNLLRRKVESAGFVVLKSPDIPSMLIETAFISNPKEEKRLKSSRYQKKLAKAILKGVKQYQIALREKDDRFA